MTRSPGVPRSRKPQRLDRLGDRLPHCRLLSNGTYTVLVSGAGSGFARSGDIALTGWNADPTEDGIGGFVYVRDVEDGQFWSAGHQPTRVEATAYTVDSTPGSVTFARTDHGIDTELSIAVDPARDLEVRRLRLVNRSERARTLEVTTYAEVVLQPLEAHRGHPAFSKLFVQTELAAEAEVALARRRPRSAGEPRPWLAHALRGPGPLEHETDRVRFIGRGRELASPIALAPRGVLSGTVGNVLDPILALRRSTRIEPGASATYEILYAVGTEREDLLVWLRESDGTAVFAAAAERERRIRRELGLRDDDAERLQDVAGAALYGHASEVTEKERAYWRALGFQAGATGASPRSEKAVRRAGRRRYSLTSSTTEDARPAAVADGNGYGTFSSSGEEYVIRVRAGSLPPMPWINVVANERCGFLASERGAGYTWSENSRENRLTPWSNDPVIDPAGEALFLRDERQRVFWSPLPGPVIDDSAYEARHGFGYSEWRHATGSLEEEVVMFVPRRDPVKITRLVLRNRGSRTRRISVFSYAQLVLGVLASETAPSVVTAIARDVEAVLARNPGRGDFRDNVAFAAAVTPPGSPPSVATCDRAVFLGRNGSTTAPAAVEGRCAFDERDGAGLDPCAALKVDLEVTPGESVECAFLLGESRGEEEARRLIARYREAGAIAQSLADVRAFWTDVLCAVRVETPSAAIDHMLNGWLLYQCLSCRIWGRSAFYQSGGAFGFRDQLQDSAALVHSRPDLTRAAIVLHAAHQFVEGDVLHWWHPPADRGTRTRCSDDLLWLPYVASFYVDATGDRAVLDENAPFVTARRLEPGEDETYLQASASGESGTVYEHCCRAIDRSLGVGRHGLPLIGTCDWNDGMNRVGREGRGESVWLGFFLFTVLESFAPIAEARGDAERGRRYRAHAAEVRRALEDAGWDGEWYRRAYYDDGTPLGSATNEECRIDALAQSWAVISGAAPAERAARAMDAAEKHLVCEEHGLIRLLTPPFDRSPQDPGYIKGYVPGIRENGGQYTHGAMWVVWALARLGRRDRAARLLEMLTPVHHTRDRAAADVYKVEPYVVAADVYGESPHEGRGGWTWYTGSAGWMYRVALEAILGIELEAGERLRIRPCVPDDWPEYTVHYRLPDSRGRYEIVVRNPGRSSASVRAVTIDGAPGEIADGAAIVPLSKDGRQHRVEVILG